MTRSRSLFVVCSLCVVVPIMSATLWGAVAKGEDDGQDSLYKYLSVFTEVLGLVNQSYVDQKPLDGLLDGALDGAPEALDPFSLYVPAEAVATYAATQGVGARRSGLLVLKEGGIAYVVAVEPGSPAATAGVQVGDIITEIAQESTRLMPMWRLRILLAGPAGSEVALQSMRLGETRKVALTLAEFVATGPKLEIQGDVGILTFAALEAATASETRVLLAQVPGTKLLVDLRGVAFGDPAAAYAVGELFVSGDLGQLAARSEVLTSYRAAGTPAWHGDVVVLTDHSTLGPGEILAAILRDGLAARLVGKATFGHAGRTELAPLSTGGRLELTSAFFTGPKKSPLDAALEPDVEVDARDGGFDGPDAPQVDRVRERGLALLAGDGEAAAPAKAA
jgi:carboxyl-terminal processing protease